MANRFISDTHLGHKRILELAKTGDNLYKRRQFADVNEMNQYILSQWREHVDVNDDVWIAGDFSFRSELGVDKYLKEIPGHLHLIIGNHDSNWMKNVELARYFESVNHMDVIKERKKLITICHYPMLEWSQSRYAEYTNEGRSWLVHGHIHDSIRCDAYHYIKEKLPCALNAGFDIPGNDYPVTFEELVENNRIWYGRN